MVDAVIVSTARTPIGKAVRGAYNMTHGAELGGHVIKHAAARANLDLGDVEDVVNEVLEVVVERAGEIHDVPRVAVGHRREDKQGFRRGPAGAAFEKGRKIGMNCPWGLKVGLGRSSAVQRSPLDCVISSYAERSFGSAWSAVLST